MKSLATALLLGLTLAMTATAGAQDEAAEEPPAKSKRELRREARAAEAEAEAEKSAEEGLVCRREAVTGTHRRIRVCYTPEQLREIREGSQEALRDLRDRAPAPPGNQ